VTGSEYLKTKSYEQVWGIGRHMLGSQVFDYWSDPFGNLVEHWTDGDVFSASDPVQEVGLDAMVNTQWGPPISPTFI
jgi:hypothetical protein